MPTGYTSHIYDGTEKSVKTYLNRVARGIGYYIHQYQDSPDAVPEALKVSDYCWEEVGRDYAALVGLRNMSPGDKQAGYDESKARYEKNYEEMEARYDELRTRYDQFIQDVTDIDFPVDDPEAGEFFKSLRKLALDQLAQARMPIPPLTASVPLRKFIQRLRIGTSRVLRLPLGRCLGLPSVYTMTLKRLPSRMWCISTLPSSCPALMKRLTRRVLTGRLLP